MPLVLSRKLNESVRIGSEITIKVIHLTANIVKLEFHAPREIEIVRTELLEQKSEKANQHDAPLGSDGGPASPQILPNTERIWFISLEDDVERVAPDLNNIGIKPR